MGVYTLSFSFVMTFEIFWQVFLYALNVDYWIPVELSVGNRFDVFFLLTA